MYKKILVPLDGSELAESALPHVKNLVKDGFAGEVIILNVFWAHIPMGGAAGEAAPYIDINAMEERIRNESLKYLADVESQLNSEGIKVKTVSLEGERPAETIAQYAKENAIELIVISTHGYTGLKKLMFGSVAMEVLHDSHAPILLIRPESCRI